MWGSVSIWKRSFLDVKNSGKRCSPAWKKSTTEHHIDADQLYRNPAGYSQPSLAKSESVQPIKEEAEQVEQEEIQ